MIKKIAIIHDILPNIISNDAMASNPEANQRFEKLVASLKEPVDIKTGRVISKKMDDFLFASCIMMHAAEASLIDQATGMPLKNKSGEPVAGKFIKVTDHRGRESLRWESPDNIRPYKNGNGDIFPEEDLLKAYKDWVGKPLCRDHVSSTVDGIRGIIIDTYYDPKHKRVHALFALDKKNYADLARKVEAGYATSVSMGTAVGRSICTECANVASTEAEYCNHVRTKSCDGEINKDLSPIELSLVVTGADPKAKIREVFAHLNEYEKKVASLAPANAEAMLGDINKDLGALQELKENTVSSSGEETTDINETAVKLINLLKITTEDDSDLDLAKKYTKDFFNKFKNNLADLEVENLHDLAGVLRALRFGEKAMLKPFLGQEVAKSLYSEDVASGNATDIGKGTALPLVDTSGASVRNEQDLLNQAQNTGKTGDMTSSAPQNFASLYINKNTNEVPTLKEIEEIERKFTALAEQVAGLRKELNKENYMTFADLKKRALERKSYFQGTEDPSKVLPYDRMGDDGKIREKEDKQMVGEELDTAAANPDEAEKKLLQRAELEARAARRAALLDNIKTAAEVVKDQSGKPVAVKGTAGDYVRIKEKAQAAKDGKASKKKEEDEEDEKPSKGMKGKKEDKKDDKKKKMMPKKKAYFQGTEDPSKVLPYPLMGDQDGLREGEDRQMHQTGNMGGDAGMVPSDETLKKGLHRIAGKKLTAQFYKSAAASNSRWEFFAGQDKVLSLTADDVYGDQLNRKVAGNTTLSDFFHSKEYGSRVLKLIRAEGPEGAAAELGVAPAAPAVEMAPAMEAGMSKGDEDLRKAVNTAVEKLEVTLEELKAAVSEEEGVADLSVETAPEAAMPAGPEAGGAPLAPPAPMATAATEKDMLEAYAFLSDIAGELSYVDMKLEQEPSEEMAEVAVSAVADANVALNRVAQLIQSYRTAKAIKRIASETAELMASDSSYAYDVQHVLDKKELKQVENVAEDVVKEHEGEMHEGEMHEDDAADHDVHMADDAADHHMMADDAADHMADDEQHAYMANDVDHLHDAAHEKLAARKAARAALVAKASKLDDLYMKERSSGGHKLENLGMTVAEDGDKVEVLHEVHEKMMDVATKDAAGPKVREAASKLDQAIKRGGINPSKLNELVALGAVDSDVVNYWKTFYGQVDGGAEFAKGLVSEFKKSASKEDSDNKIVRYKRAYMLGMEAQEKGLVSRSSSALNEFVDNMVNLPDVAFNSFKNLVAQTKAPVKGAVPQVGVTQESGFEVKASQESDHTAPTVENLARALMLK